MHSRSDPPLTGDFPGQTQPSSLVYPHALLLTGNLKALARLASVSGGVDSIVLPIFNLLLETNPMPRRSTPKGIAFIEEIFYKTAIARRDGSVRRSIAKIERHQSLRCSPHPSQGTGMPHRAVRAGFFNDGRNLTRWVLSAGATGAPV